MKLHTQSSINHRRDEESTMSISQNTPPSSPKTLKHPRSLPRSINYILKEQRLLFILVGILIGSTFFILQPSLSLLNPSSPIPKSYHGFDSVPAGIHHTSTVTTPYRIAGSVTGRVPVGIGRKRTRVVVTGGAGFVGSHLVDKLIKRGDDVIVIDNFFTGRKENVMHHFGNHRFELIRHDVVEPILLEVDQIYHLACPASPVHYKYNPVKTIISFVYISIWIEFDYEGTSDMFKCCFIIFFNLDVLEILNCDYKTNVMGTLNMLGLAKRIGAKFLLTSTSEVYGDPLEHPQKETYWGNVNPIGVRSCYDEGKRTAETLTMDYHRGADVEVRIARIFNTYGPRMCLDDGRVVSNFVAQAIRKQPMTVYGDGKQTRSFQYVSDLVDGLMALMDGDHIGPFNLGNPGEFTMLELAEVVKEVIDPSATIEFKANTADDPHKRKPDISKAKELLNWEPKIPLRDGLPLMVNDFRNRILNEDEGKGN
uniref:UDP-glucuronate decarboxylase n=1 Tax=Solanum lycopersicum TaxID=4081 RepID=A0A3Q7IP63_SOLLC